MIDAGPVIIRPATVSDAAALSAFGREQFARTFAPENEAANLDAYLGAHFGESVQRGELADSRVHVLVAEVDGAWAGYTMASTRGEVPVCVVGVLPWQIERFYVDKAWHGQGLADALMDATLEAIARANAQVVWLAVWEHNVRAMRFYERCGFVDVGSTSFLMGADRQTDRVFARPVRDRRAVAQPRSTVRRPALLVRMERGRDGRDLLACVRADGTSSWLRRPDGMLRRDRILIAIEATLAPEQGVFAQVAGGADLGEFMRGDDGAGAGVAGWETRLAALLDGSVAHTHNAHAIRAAIGAAMGAMPPDAPDLDDGALLALRGACARLELAWRGLAAGDALEFAIGIDRS